VTKVNKESQMVTKRIETNKKEQRLIENNKKLQKVTKAIKNHKEQKITKTNNSNRKF
jgi:hypothetical protein